MTPKNGRFKTLCKIETDKNYKNEPFEFFKIYEDKVLSCIYPYKISLHSFCETFEFKTVDDIEVLKIPSLRVRVDFEDDETVLKVLERE